MDVFLQYAKAFLVGGALCLIGELLIDKTRLTPARILTSYVVIGVLLGGLGIYQPFIDWAGAGASVPLTGFGNALAQGVKRAITERGPIGILTGGLTAASAGMCAAIVFALVAALISKAREK